MKPEEAIEILERKKKYSERVIDDFLDYSSGEIKDAEQTIEMCDIAISALKEVQQYREIGTIEEIRKMINQGINNCYMSHKYEHPGYEEGMCAGLRTMNGDGEPVYKCKLCRLNYLFERSEG